MEKDVVRAGYDAMGEEYTAGRAQSERELTFLGDFARRLPDGARVLDAGCGAGVPVAEWLSRRFSVAGVDISEGQIARARRRVPRAELLCMDMTAIDLPTESLDAVCSLYAVIHIPRDEHPSLLLNFHRMLRPGGLLLFCMGAGDWPGAVEEFFGAPMYWSHHDTATNLTMIQGAGFELIRWELVAEALDGESAGKHLFVLARRR